MIEVKVESFSKSLGELAPLFFQHGDEVELIPKTLMPLAPNWQLYVMKERTGELMTVVARDAGRVVGYYMAFVSPCPHYSTTLRATQDNIRTLPEYRAKGVAIQMLAFAEQELKRRGAQIWHCGSRISSPFHEPANKLFLKAGFVPADLYYAKWIG